MKYLIALVLIMAYSAQAQDCSEEVTTTHGDSKYSLEKGAAAYLKGATITVTLADGSSSAVPAERFKVVPRIQQFMISTIETTKVISCQASKNRLSALGGVGARNGLKTTTSGNTTVVETSSGAVGGLQYQHMLNDTLSLGVQGQSNKTGSVLIGLDF